MKDWGVGFSRFAHATAIAAGKPKTFALAVAVVIIWALSGPFFGFSDTWQLVINTSTTIVTFLMVFLLQHTQNRDSIAVQVKLDELIVAIHGARNAIIEAENMDEERLKQLQGDFQKIARESRACAEEASVHSKT